MIAIITRDKRHPNLRSQMSGHCADVERCPTAHITAAALSTA